VHRLIKKDAPHCYGAPHDVLAGLVTRQTRFPGMTLSRVCSPRSSTVFTFQALAASSLA
jgi:hypothetical protein